MKSCPLDCSDTVQLDYGKDFSSIKYTSYFIIYPKKYFS